MERFATGGGKRPNEFAGMKGKDIGMYHKNKQKAKQQNEDRGRLKISFSEEDRQNLQECLDRCSKSYGEAGFSGLYEKKSTKPKNIPQFKWLQVQQMPTTDKFVHSSGLVKSVRSELNSNSSINSLAMANETESFGVAANDEDQLDDDCDGTSLCVDDLLPPVAALSEKAQSASFVLPPKNPSPKFRQILLQRQKLPAFIARQSIIDAVNSNRVVVIEGETGCGKSTQVPQFILEDRVRRGLGPETLIICTQPRRISAISLAERVAQERDESLGESVGYQIRLTNVAPRSYDAALVFCTTGILLRWLHSDQTLGRVSHLILDEIHERDLFSDFLMIVLRDLLVARPDLHLILMSATLDAKSFVRYFQSFQPVLKSIEGKMFDVKEFYLEEIFEMTAYQPKPLKKPPKVPIWKIKSGRAAAPEEQSDNVEEIKRFCDKKRVPDKIRTALLNWDENNVDLQLIFVLAKYICNRTNDDGALLIFLPGWQEISTVFKWMEKDEIFGNKSKFIIVPLHSMLPHLDQQKVFFHPENGQRKIVLSTNIAETSVTIDDVVYVINCGKIKQDNFDQRLNVSSLDNQWVSLANCQQRKGRAGRCRDGVCFHLYPSFYKEKIPPKIIPEMQRVRLESLCLQIKLLFSTEGDSRSSCVDFLAKSLDPPDLRTVQLALDELFSIGAIDEYEKLTPLGCRLARLPIEPHCGKMILYAALFSCLDPILTVVACLDFKDPFHTPIGMEQAVDQRKHELCPVETYSDYMLWINVLYKWQEEMKKSDLFARHFANENFMNHGVLVMIEQLKQQFVDHLRIELSLGYDETSFDEWNRNSNDYHLIRSVIVAGLYPKVTAVKKTFPNRPPLLRAEKLKSLTVHKRSVNASADPFPFPHLVFHMCQKSRGQVKLHDCAIASPLSLVLFAERITFIEDSKNLGLIKVNDLIKFSAHPNTFRLLSRLNEHLKRLFQRRICHEDDQKNREMLDVDLQLIAGLQYLLKNEKY